MTFWLIVFLASAGGWLWLRRQRLRSDESPVDDPDQLAAAERDLDNDWGPGAPH